MPITSQICIVVTSKWPPSIWCLSKRSRGDDTMDWLTDSHSFATQGFYSGFWMDCMWRTSPRPKDWSATSTPAGNLKSRKAWCLHPFTTNMEVSSAVLQPMTFRCPQTWLENPSDLRWFKYHWVPWFLHQPPLRGRMFWPCSADSHLQLLGSHDMLSSSHQRSDQHTHHPLDHGVWVTSSPSYTICNPL